MKNKLTKIKPNEKIVYHIGNIQEQSEYETVRDIRALAWELYNAGIVELLQRRIDDNCFEYIAIGKKNRVSILEQKKKKQRMLNNEMILRRTLCL